jgi:hypothetical protein
VKPGIHPDYHPVVYPRRQHRHRVPDSFDDHQLAHDRMADSGRNSHPPLGRRRGFLCVAPVLDRIPSPQRYRGPDREVPPPLRPPRRAGNLARLAAVLNHSHVPPQEAHMTSGRCSTSHRYC